jgi:hypothetical protein
MRDTQTTQTYLTFRVVNTLAVVLLGLLWFSLFCAIVAFPTLALTWMIEYFVGSLWSEIFLRTASGLTLIFGIGLVLRSGFGTWRRLADEYASSSD